MRNLFLAILAFCSLTVIAFPQQETSPAAGDNIRISKDHPTVYITFERFGKAINPMESRIAETGVTSKSREKGEDVWLRLHNNTHWSIVFPTWSYYVGKLSVPYRPSEGSSYKLSDGMEVNAIYKVRNSDGKRVLYGGDSFSYSWLPPGRSIIFSVRRDHLSRDRNISIVFSYEWEMDDRGFPSNGEPSHAAEYDRSQVPEK